MSRFRELVADPLEQTWDMSGPIYSQTGVFRIVRNDDAPADAWLTMQRAPELSVRYPSIRTDFSRRQAE